MAAGAEDGIRSLLLLQVGGDVEEEEGGVAERGGEAIVVDPFCVCLWWWRMSMGDDTGKSGLLDDVFSSVGVDVAATTVMMAAGEEFCRGGMEGEDDDPSSPATLDFFNCMASSHFRKMSRALASMSSSSNDKFCNGTMISSGTYHTNHN